MCELDTTDLWVHWCSANMMMWLCPRILLSHQSRLLKLHGGGSRIERLHDIITVNENLTKPLS